MRASVSNIDLFRVWKDDEDLDLAWIRNRILAPFEQTPAMKAGEMFHKALELAGEGELHTVVIDGYRFDFDVDCDIETTQVREIPVSAQYGELLVRGRVDSVIGKMIVDYKTTTQFDPDRLLFGYQWRFYLDMMQADRFRWNVFVLRETDDPMHFLVADAHTLEQTRYPQLHDDCLRLAKDYADFAKEHLQPETVLSASAVAA